MLLEVAGFGGTETVRPVMSEWSRSGCSAMPKERRVFSSVWLGGMHWEQLGISVRVTSRARVTLSVYSPSGT